MHSSIELNSLDWRLALCPRETGAPDWEDAIPARVPGNVIRDLCAAGRLPDPYFAENFRACQWAAECAFVYRTDFTLDRLGVGTVGPGTRFLLHFDGIDTFAEVFLNSHSLGRARNMFRRFSFDLTDLVLPRGENVLEVRIDPPLECAREFIRENKIDTSEWLPTVFGYDERLVTRKAQMSYGWDQTPHLIAGGIYRPVSLEVRQGPVLLVPTWFVSEVDPESARALLHISGSVSERFEGRVRVAASCRGRAFSRETTVDGRDWGLEVDVENALLWWPNGAGEPNLYATRIDLLSPAGEVVDSRSLQIGLRIVEVVTEPKEVRTVDYRIGPDSSDRQGMDGKPGVGAWERIALARPEQVEVSPLNFKVNGRPVFIKGFNWQNPDALFGCETSEQIGALLDMAQSSHANMLRLWGGGTIETDEFYRGCSQRGLLVWQDFYFACAVYPRDEVFLDEIRIEASDMVERLRNHACIACWCGDNESDMVEYDNGRDYTANPINKAILPETVRRLDPQRRYYHTSSPSGGPYPRSDWGGDKRNWGAGETGDNYKHIRQEMARFMSEGGSLALPCRETIEKFMPDTLRFPIHNQTWRFHRSALDRSSPMYPDDRIDKWLAAFGGYADLDEAIEKSQFAQAWGLKLTVDCLRQRKYDCGGVLLWKLGQCWPCMEYAIVDYYLRPMMALAYVTEAMKPVATSFRHEPQDDAALEVFVVNDRWDEIDGRLTVVAAELDSAGGPQLVEVIGDVVLTVPADRSLGAMSFPPSRFDPERVVFFSRFASRETSYGAYSLRPKAAYDLLRVSGFSLSASMQSLAPLHLARSTAGPGAARTFE